MAHKTITPKAAKAKEPKPGPKSRRKMDPKDVAIVGLAPCYNGAALVKAFTHGTFGEIDLLAAGHELSKRCTDVHGNHTERMQDMLLAQAHSLDVIFASLGRRAARNVEHGDGQFLNAADTYMKLALRAQNQCRMTLETLATIKNPPVVFAKQANIANNQQVNNGEAVTVARGENQHEPNKQSRLAHEIRQPLDGRALPAAIGSDTALAAVEEVNGTEKRGG